MIKTRMTREQSREQTRQRLLEAAREVFLNKGYVAASLEDVTEHAGYTRGAFYSNFSGKDELLLLLLERDHQEMMAALRGIFDNAASRSEMEQRMLAYYSGLHQGSECFLLWAEAKLLAMRDKTFGQAFLDHQREMRAAIADYIREFSSRVGTPLTMSAEELAIGLIALCDGMQLSYAFDPQVVTTELTRQVLAGFFQRVVLPAAGG